MPDEAELEQLQAEQESDLDSSNASEEGKMLPDMEIHSTEQELVKVEPQSPQAEEIMN